MPGLLTSKVRVYECSFEPYSSSLQNEQNPSSNRVSQKYNIKTTGEGHYQVSPSNWLRWMKRWILQGVLLKIPPTSYWSTFLSFFCRCLHTFLLLLAQIFFPGNVQNRCHCSYVTAWMLYESQCLLRPFVCKRFPVLTNWESPAFLRKG